MSILGKKTSSKFQEGGVYSLRKGEVATITFIDDDGMITGVIDDEPYDWFPDGTYLGGVTHDLDMFTDDEYIDMIAEDIDDNIVKSCTPVDVVGNYYDEYADWGYLSKPKANDDIILINTIKMSI